MLNIFLILPIEQLTSVFLFQVLPPTRPSRTIQ